MTLTAFPYRVPNDTTVTPLDWNILIDDTPLYLGDHIPDWDYNTDLILTRIITIDTDQLCSDTGLPPGTNFAVSIVWSASGSNQRGQGFRKVFSQNGIQNIEARLLLEGAYLGGTLSLETMLTLADDLVDAPPFAAHKGGSLLWSDSVSIRLQGDAPQFPIAILDFTATSFPAEAAWYLQIGTNLHAATMGSLLLCVNEGNKAASAAFKNAARPAQVDLAIISSTYTDVARTLIEYALTNAEFDDETDFPEDSLGAMLQALIQTRFPDTPLPDLRQHRDNSPALFSSIIQASARIFEEIE
ncbi:hypothetical protein [Rhodococcus sp. OK302]|uniref:hypothetical protein n=1 Tax=Rhodococcus sp. OK302 TaxID=1882769 RepID=UPI000B9416B2|nr:hypothetical protein [Rhodococcus sp. OK302]OYD71392.1 hypothetical protein BDB13_5063 [Rhodococcus sp. OK302]